MREAFLTALSDRVAASAIPAVRRVAIDGVDGAGKTVLADELAALLRTRGHVVIRAGMDSFHNPRSVRYARGKDSPEGFFRDSFNLDRVRELLLDPLSPGGTGRYRTRAFDLGSNLPVEAPLETAVIPSILIFDGIFLQRLELRGYWDLVIFLDVPFAASYARMSARDGSDPDPMALSNRRYHKGQQLYFAECRPREAADIVVDYADLDVPRIVRG